MMTSTLRILVYSKRHIHAPNVSNDFMLGNSEARMAYLYVVWIGLELL